MKKNTDLEKKEEPSDSVKTQGQIAPTTRSVRVRAEHIREEWSEASSGDGYWIALKAGWKWEGDPVGAVHSIHEDTRAKAHQQGVLPCQCQDCAPSVPSAPENHLAAPVNP